MKSAEEILRDSKESAEIYVKTEFERFKLLGVKQATRFLALVAKLLLGLSLAIMSVVFLLISLALYWGEAIRNFPLAFLYTGLIILVLLAIIIVLSRFIITRPIMRGLIKEIFNSNE